MEQFCKGIVLVTALVLCANFTGCAESGDSANSVEITVSDSGGDLVGEERSTGEGRIGQEVSWVDPATGLTWQNPAADGTMSLAQATAHCDSLQLAGSRWRLPSVGELRSLIRGCPLTETGGVCNVAPDDCLGWGCPSQKCEGCSPKEGPANGCYWPAMFADECTWYWTSSLVADQKTSAWYVNFPLGSIHNIPTINLLSVRCVR